MLFAKSTGGFYDLAIHGRRTLTIVDPAWQHPTIEIPDPDWRAEDYPAGTPHPLITVPDPAAIPPTVEVPNPDCKVPADAVEITAEEHAALLAAQSAGKRIEADAAGRPIAVDPPAPPLDQVRAAALAAIDAAAGAARARYITIAPGQEATYLIKAQQARDYRAAGYTGPVPALVQAEADATGETPAAACDSILAEEAVWVAKAALIESARRRGKVAVGAAADAAAVEAARDAALAELAGL